MADSKKRDADESSVLANLPSTRPQRIGGRRARDAAAPAAPRKAGSAPSPAKAAGKTATSTSKRTAAETTKATATASKAEAAAAAAKPARKSPGAKAKPRPKAGPVAAPKAKATAPRKTAAKTGPIPLAAAEKSRPRAVRAGHPGLEESTPKSPPPRSDGDQSGLDLVKTVVQAAGEVAQIGATVGGQILKRAVDALPKRP